MRTEQSKIDLKALETTMKKYFNFDTLNLIVLSKKPQAKSSLTIDKTLIDSYVKELDLLIDSKPLKCLLLDEFKTNFKLFYQKKYLAKKELDYDPTYKLVEQEALQKGNLVEVVSKYGKSTFVVLNA